MHRAAASDAHTLQAAGCKPVILVRPRARFPSRFLSRCTSLPIPLHLAHDLAAISLPGGAHARALRVSSAALRRGARRGPPLPDRGLHCHGGGAVTVSAARLAATCVNRLLYLGVGWLLWEARSAYLGLSQLEVQAARFSNQGESRYDDQDFLVDQTAVIDEEAGGLKLN